MRRRFRSGGEDAGKAGGQLESLVKREVWVRTKNLGEEGANSVSMRDSFFFGWIFRAVRKRGRERDLLAAAAWPTVTAKVIAGNVVQRDELAEGPLAQTSQIEVQYYFSLGNDFFGGYLRSVPCSDSEGRRWLREVPEGTPVTVRYDPADPDKTHALATDNAGTLPFTVWEM
jgi:hypothetical protein